MRVIYFLLCAVISGAVFANESLIVPYVGLDTQLRRVDFKGGYGSNMFAKRVPQGEIYTGLKLNPYLGIELGYLSSEERHHSSVVTEPDLIFGTPVGNPGDFEIGMTNFKIDSGRVNVVSFLPITQDFQILGSLGLARLKVKLRYIPVEFSGAVFNSEEVERFTRDFVAYRYVPQAKVGVQYMLNPAVGLKASVGWEGTSRFNLLINRQASAARVSLKDSYNVGLGLTYYFN
jgi:hypothetical protein